MPGILIVFVTDVLGHFEIRFQRGPAVDHPRHGQRARIFDGDFHFHVPEVDAVEGFGQMHLFRVRRSGEVIPGNFVEADRIHHQRVTIPVRARVSIPGRLQIFGMTAAIDKELPVHVSISLKEHQHQFRRREQRRVIWRRAWRPARQTSRLEIFRASFGPVIRYDLRRPGLHRALSAASSKTVPHAAQVRDVRPTNAALGPGGPTAARDSRDLSTGGPPSVEA